MCLRKPVSGTTCIVRFRGIFSALLLKAQICAMARSFFAAALIGQGIHTALPIINLPYYTKMCGVELVMLSLLSHSPSERLAVVELVYCGSKNLAYIS
jgi:hypothetical protein